jgi:phospholipid/cholesterol/gamma-HCH transport system substrate-binding protein
MSSRKREIQVGVTVIVAVVILVVGMLWLKQVRVGGGDHHYVVQFPTVSGLEVGDKVQVRGIAMGKVASLDIDGNMVRVELDISSRVTLCQDAQITVEALGIVGEEVVNVLPGNGAPAPSGYVFQGSAPPTLLSMSGDASKTLTTVDDLATEMRDLVHELRTQGHLTGTLASAQSALDNVDTTLTQNRAKVTALINDLQASVGALRVAVAGPDSGFGRTLRDTRRTLTSADSALAIIDRASSALLRVTNGLERGQGTAGMLLKDDQLYKEATAAVADVRDLIKDFKRNPRRYVKVSLF